YLAWANTFPAMGMAYAQHLAADGAIFPGWPRGGLMLAGSFGNSTESPYAIPDGAGGAYVAWDERLNPMNSHEARLTRLSPGGPVGDGPPPTPVLSLARIAPNPASGLFTVSATMPDDRPAKLEVFDLAGRVTLVREVLGAGERA